MDQTPGDVTYPVGTLRTWIHSYWNAKGPQLMQNEGVTEVAPHTIREWMLAYIDGESPEVPNIVKFWKRLTRDQKVEHLLDAFPDVTA